VKISITTPAKFPPAFHAARYHHGRDELARIISTVPRSRLSPYAPPSGRIIAMTPLGAWNRVIQRLAPRTMQPPHQLAFSAAFDLAASRSIGDADAVNAWCSTALHTIRAAHARGLPVVLEAASAHVVAQAQILRDEHRRWRLPAPAISERVLARTVAEYAEADVIVVMSQYSRRTFIEQGVPASKLVVVPCGVDVPSWIERAPHDGPPRVLFVGGATVRKGIPYLLEAARRLRTDATLRIVGAVDAPLIARLGDMPPNVELAGPRTRHALAAEYAAADLFVLPSVEDGFGLVTAEAMAAGLPVIVSDRAGSADIVEDGVSGFVVPAGDAPALARRIDDLASDARLRSTMGRVARASVEARTWERYGDEREMAIYAPLRERATGRLHAVAA
jgi:glycosyltransferase involved in cell wall biosynthesis